MQCAFTIIKNCLMFIDHFLLLGVYCTESSDISFILESPKDLIVKNQNEPSTNEMKTRDDELKIKKEDKQDNETIIKEPASILSCGVHPLTREVENSEFIFNLIRIKIQENLIELESILNFKVPNIFEDCRKINNLYEEVKKKIEEVKEKFKPFESPTLIKVEIFFKQKSKFYSNYNSTIIDLRKKSDALKSSFEGFRFKINEFIPKLTPSVLNFMANYGCNFFIMKLDCETKILINYLNSVETSLARNIKQANSTNLVFSELLTLTLEEFMGSKKVERILSLLN